MSTGKSFFLFQDGIEVVYQGLVADVAVVALDHIALPVDQKRGGNAENTAKGCRSLRVAQQYGIVDLHLLGEFINQRGAALIGGDADHGETLWPVFLLELDERRDFLAAGRSPGGEEIDQHGLALVAAGLDHGAILHGRQGKGGHLGGGLGPARHQGEKDKGQGEKAGCRRHGFSALHVLLLG